MAQTTALEKWQHYRENTIDLPSGAGTATVQALDLTEAIVNGKIPNPLRGIAITAEGGALNPAQLDEKGVTEWFELRCWVVAQAVKEFKPKQGAIVRGPLDQAFVADQMPPEDRDQVFATATHVLTAEQLMNLMGLSTFRRGQGRTGAAPRRPRDRQAPK